MNLKKEEVFNLVLDSYKECLLNNDNLVDELNSILGSSIYKYDYDTDEIVIKEHRVKLIPHSKIEYNRSFTQEDWQAPETVYIPNCLINKFGLEKTFNKYTGLNTNMIVSVCQESYFQNGEIWSVYQIPEEV